RRGWRRRYPKSLRTERRASRCSREVRASGRKPGERRAAAWRAIAGDCPDELSSLTTAPSWIRWADSPAAWLRTGLERLPAGWRGRRTRLPDRERHKRIEQFAERWPLHV